MRNLPTVHSAFRGFHIYLFTEPVPEMPFTLQSLQQGPVAHSASVVNLQVMGSQQGSNSWHSSIVPQSHCSPSSITLFPHVLLSISNWTNPKSIIRIPLRVLLNSKCEWNNPASRFLLFFFFFIKQIKNDKRKEPNAGFRNQNEEFFYLPGLVCWKGKCRYRLSRLLYSRFYYIPKTCTVERSLGRRWIEPWCIRASRGSCNHFLQIFFSEKFFFFYRLQRPLAKSINVSGMK